METKAPRAPKPPRSSPKATLAVYSPLDLIERVDRHAVARGIGRSAAAIDLLEDALSRHDLARIERASGLSREDHAGLFETTELSK